MDVCYSGTIDANKKIFVSILVAPANWWSSGGLHPLGVMPNHVVALVDTGANISCITPALAKKLNLISEDQYPVTTSDGESFKDIYRIDMRAQVSSPNPKGKIAGKMVSKDFHNIEVMETYGDINRMLLGMDIITRGSLEIKGNTFTFCL